MGKNVGKSLMTPRRTRLTQELTEVTPYALLKPHFTSILKASKRSIIKIGTQMTISIATRLLPLSDGAKAVYYKDCEIPICLSSRNNFNGKN